MKRTAVIMAGGSGERFWPLSRMKKPKQLLTLASEKTMLEESINRISELIDVTDIYIITSEVLLEPIRQGIPNLPAENVIAEPHKRNTAPCLALAASFIQAKYEGEFSKDEISIAVLTADQSIKPNYAFLKTVDSAMTFVEQNKALCTIGIVPNRPETGYGYVEVNDKFDFESKEAEIKQVKQFKEKPELETAKEYVAAGNYLWNSGMFFWRLDYFIDEMTRCLPEVGGQIDTISAKYKSKTKVALPEALGSIADIFESFPNTSIDYGLMEKAENVYVAKALFEWDDIGSWDSLYRVKDADDNENIVQGKSVLVDVENSIIINSDKSNKMMVAGLGLKDTVIVMTEDSVMVCPVGRVQEVKICVEKLRENNDTKWL